MATYLLLTFYCIFIVLASLSGGALPWLVRFTHRQMQLLMSFVGGLMLGVAVLHLFPHGVYELGRIKTIAQPLDLSAIWLLAGLLCMFMLIRVFHVHAHEHGDTSDVGHGPHCEHDHDHGVGHHHHGHGHEPLLHLGAKEAAGDSAHRFSWVGLAIGLSLHTLIDGLALGAAVQAEMLHAHWLAGLGTFLAVALHKPLDALSITSLMAAGGWTRRQAWLANILFALMCPIGAFAFVAGSGGLGGYQTLVVGCALAFSAGVFLCISLADLLPELAFHAHDRLPLTVVLLIGVALAWVIGKFEPAHTHSLQQPPPKIEQHDHSHSKDSDGNGR
ncbi:ZIP family metal transporter [Anatilimnocola floriformis]|uniref:ZIP family metal transporter n=1 Tax=Anatilimnocola floriformis TaxID=2948575 RepID=UPI0020C1DD0A|nr:ZIP family metal transporter [Anatilimnocola floriformis]